MNESGRMMLDMNMIKYSDIVKARENISPYINETPLLRVFSLEKLLGCEVYLKLENEQLTRSFKIRGAMNSLLNLSKEEREKGVICSSSGNHGQGIAYGASLLGISAKVVMLSNANPTKMEKIKSYGGELIVVGETSSERDKIAENISIEEGRTFIHPYDNDFVRAGQGTIALEIIDKMPDIDTIIVPVGSGGLISGISVCAKSSNCNIEIMGAEPKGACRYYLSKQEGRPISLNKVETIADGTRTDTANNNNFEYIMRNVDELILAEESTIKYVMDTLMHSEGIVAEPSGALAIAAYIDSSNDEKFCSASNRKSSRDKRKICFVVSGGNV